MFNGLSRVTLFFMSHPNLHRASYGLVVKKPSANAGDSSQTPGSGRFPGERNGSPLQYSCLENRMVRGAWQATVQGVSNQSDAAEQLNKSPQEKRNNNVQAAKLNTDVKARMEPNIRSFVTKFISELVPIETFQKEKFISHPI